MFSISVKCIQDLRPAAHSWLIVNWEEHVDFKAVAPVYT